MKDWKQSWGIEVGDRGLKVEMAGEKGGDELKEAGTVMNVVSNE